MREDAAFAGAVLARVVIPTLREPVGLVSLIQERGDHRSMVTLAGTNQPTGIAAAYHAFVDHSTGVVNRLFPKPDSTFYRIEVEGAIEAGQSFQLPVLIAHALREDGNRLAALGAIGERPNAEPKPAAELIWATGTIAPVTYAVGRVDSIKLKLEASRRLFEAALAAGQTVRILVPAANADELTPDLAQWLVTLGLVVEQVQWMDDALERLGLPPIPRAATPVTSPTWKGNPYRGLDVFDAEHRGIFFGRGRARAEAAQLLRAAALAGRPFLLVHGPSGVGKSSLVLAGLLPDITEMESGWEAVALKPTGGLDSLHVILRLLQGSSSTEKPVSAEAHVAACEAMIPAIEARHKTEGKRTLLVIDQLEELFNPQMGTEEARAYGQILERLVQTGVVWVVTTIRSDLLPAIDRLPELGQLASSQRSYRVAAPSPYELLEIISAPAALAGRPFEHRFAEELAAVATRSPNSLPLLEALLYRLFELNTNPQNIAGSLEQLGGFEGAIRTWADSVHAAILSVGVPEAALNRALVSLVRIDQTGALLSQSRRYRPETDSGAVHARLVEARLATTSNDAGVPEVRLAHDALTTHWPLLARLGERLGAAIALRDELEADASRWRRSKDDRTRLLRGEAQLVAAETLIADGLVELGADVAPFVAASLKAASDDAAAIARLEGAELAGRRLRRTLFGTMAAAVLLLVVIVPVAVLLWVDARVADIREALADGNVETAQAEWASLLVSPVAPIVPFTESGVAVSGTLLDTPKVTTVMAFPGSKTAVAPGSTQALSVGVGDVTFFYFGDAQTARMVRCQQDGTTCESIDLPGEWRQDDDKLGVVLWRDGDQAVLAEDYWEEDPTTTVQSARFNAKGPLRGENIEVEAQEIDRLDPRAEVEGAFPAPQIADSCDEEFTTCLAYEYLDAHGSELRYDLWRKRGEGWVSTKGLQLPLPSHNISAISRYGEWIALTVDTQVMVWRADQVDEYHLAPYWVLNLTEPPRAMRFDRSGTRLLAETDTRILRVDLQQRLSIDRSARIGPVLRSADDLSDRYTLVESLTSAYALDMQEGELSKPIPIRTLVVQEDDGTKTVFSTEISVDTDAEVALAQFEPDQQTHLYAWPSADPIGVSFTMGLNPFHIWKGGGQVAALEQCDIAVYDTSDGTRRAVEVEEAMPDCDAIPDVVEERPDGLTLQFSDGDLYNLATDTNALRLDPQAPEPDTDVADISELENYATDLVPSGQEFDLEEVATGRHMLGYPDPDHCAGENNGSVILLENAVPVAELRCAGLMDIFLEEWGWATTGDVTYVGQYWFNGLVRWTSAGVTMMSFAENGSTGTAVEREVMATAKDGPGGAPVFDMVPLGTDGALFGATNIIPSPDGKTIGYWKSRSGTGQTDVKLSLLDLQTHTIRFLNNRFGTFFDEIVDAAFSPDGALVLTYKSEGSGWELFRVDDGWRVPFPPGVLAASFVDANRVKLVFDTGAIGTWQVPDTHAGTGRLIELGGRHG